jgi:hypothetical protein
MAQTTHDAGPASQRALWFAVFVGPTAWTAHLLLSYFLVPLACATGGTLLLHLITLACALAPLAGAVVALRGWGQVERADTAHPEEQPSARSYLALVGFLLSALFLFVVLVEGLPPFFLSPCGPLPWVRPGPL